MSSIKSDNLNSSDTHSKLLKLGTMTTSTGPCATCARLPYGLCSGRCQTRSSTILLRQIYPRILPPRPRSRTHESQSSCSCLRMSRQRASSEWCMRSSGTGLGPDLEQVRAATCLKDWKCWRSKPFKHSQVWLLIVNILAVGTAHSYIIWWW